MARNYIPVNQGKLESDVRNANIKLKEADGYSVSIRLEKNGLPHSALYGIKEMWHRHSEFDDDDYECSTPGLVGLAKLNQICAIWGLNSKDYVIKKKEKVVEKVVMVEPPVQENNIDDLIVTINKLGNILMQSMEYQRECMNYLAQMNAKYNKPSAYIPKKR